MAEQNEQEITRLRAHIELLEFCLTQAHIVLAHFETTSPDPEQQRLAHGALLASAMPTKDEVG